jgi:hypothetical protein
VNKLFRGVLRNKTLPINFICYTDNPKGVECETRPFLEPLPHWWYIIGLFNPAHGFIGKTVYFDLDTVILQNIDPILSFNANFSILRDFYRPEGLQTAFISWESEWGSFVWERFKAQFKPKHYDRLLKFGGGTNQFIEEAVGTGKDIIRIQDEFPGMCISYKVHVRDKQQSCDFDKARIVFFHGKPRPHEVTFDWLSENWA